MGVLVLVFFLRSTLVNFSSPSFAEATLDQAWFEGDLVGLLVVGVGFDVNVGLAVCGAGVFTAGVGGVGVCFWFIVRAVACRAETCVCRSLISFVNDACMLDNCRECCVFMSAIRPDMALKSSPFEVPIAHER